MGLPKASGQRRSEQFADFHSRIHDFAWMVDWKAAGKPFCHVYVVGPKDERPVKVGITTDGYKRLAGLQTGNWQILMMLRSVWVGTSKEAKKLEYETHRALQRHHLCGEWFDQGAQEALETVEWAAKYHGIELCSGIPEEMVDSVFAEVRSRADFPYDDKEKQHDIRAAALKSYGISRSTIIQIRGQECGF